MIENTILFEDEAIMVFDKPAGLVVNEAETQHNATLQQWLEQEKKIPLDRGGIVHRLDKDTSGVLIVAKTQAALESLQQQFHDRIVAKQYLALVHDFIEEDQGTINLPLARSVYNRQKFHENAAGRPAETSWKVEQRYTLPLELLYEMGESLSKNQKRYCEAYAQNYTLVRLFPKTGRTHQIRVHMTALRHPLVSDTLYTSRKLCRLDLRWCPRQFLHAQSLSVTHPVTGERLTFTADLPEDLTHALSILDT